MPNDLAQFRSALMPISHEDRMLLETLTFYRAAMNTSAKALQEAISIRRQIDALEKRLSSILGGSAPKPIGPTGGRYFSSATRAKLSAAAKARWARLKGTTKTAAARKKGELTPAGRRRLSQLMKARWAARRKVAGTKRRRRGSNTMGPTRSL
jgi:hypothetical protein